MRYHVAAKNGEFLMNGDMFMHMHIYGMVTNLGQALLKKRLEGNEPKSVNNVCQ